MCLKLSWHGLTPEMKLREALGIHKKEVISLVGAGGKTTLMFALAKELMTAGPCVITTTTTKILEPSLLETEKLILNDDEDELLGELRDKINEHRHITIARKKLVSGKLIGITPEMAIRVARLNRVSHLIIEADGAARHSLKAPNETEPVIPANASLVIAVVGIDALGRQIGEETVFRASLAATLLQVSLGTIISAELVAKLVTHPWGIAKGSPETARIVPFINKLDLPGGLAKARQVALEILSSTDPRISTVLLGQAQDADPVKEIVRRGQL